MKRNVFLVATVVALAVGLAVILAGRGARTSSEEAPATGLVKRRASGQAEKSPSGGSAERPWSTGPVGEAISETRDRESRHDPEQRSDVGRGVDSTGPVDSGVAGGPKAVRLGASFRLPAVMLEGGPDDRHESSGEASSSLPVRKAKEALVMDFYRKVAATAAPDTGGSAGMAGTLDPQGSADGRKSTAGGSVDDIGQIPSGVDGTETEEFVIEPGGEADRIRREADEWYRILYGNDAFNLRSMEAAIEATLPAAKEAE